MTAVETLLAGLFDYAGLYPPASLGMRSAANNYLAYRQGKNAPALGSFIVNLDRLDELRSVADDVLKNCTLSVIATEDSHWSALAAQISDGVRIQAVEIKCSDPSEIQRIAAQTPAGLAIYFEVPMDASHPVLNGICAAGARAKIRTGGVIPEAFPSAGNLAQILKALADLKLSFKATAGLHHPLRSPHPLTYQPQSPTGVMHGFVNVSAAAALLYFGGSIEEAQRILAEEDSAAWNVKPDSLHWRDRTWTRSTRHTPPRVLHQHWNLLLRRTAPRFTVSRMAMKSWVASANEPGTDFPLENLPYGVFRHGKHTRIGIAIGDQILDVRAAAEKWDPLESTCRHASLSIL